MKNKLKGMKGITLIALVITIIVLLILAGVGIAMLTGENGILTQAENASKETEISQAIERAKLDILKWRAKQIKNKQSTTLTNEIIKEILNDSPTKKQYIEDVKGDRFTTKNGHEIFFSELDGSIQEGTTPSEDEVVVGQIVTGSNKTYTKNGTAKIPVGFAIVPGCDDVSKGLVISDVANDTNDIGNQFVWIPVTDGNKYKRNTTYKDIDVSAVAIDDTDYLPEGITDEKQAVLNAGGFYIGRYEAGDSSASYFRNGERSGTLVIQKNKCPYTYIKHIDAKLKSKTFINNNNVKSALISGTQWDVVMDTVNGKLDGTGQSFDVREETESRHTWDISRTGQNIADKVYNIYDLEGNCWERAAERHTDDVWSSFIYRGGYWYSGAASNRYTDSGTVYSSDAFRVVLYVM